MAHHRYTEGGLAQHHAVIGAVTAGNDPIETERLNESEFLPCFIPRVQPFCADTQGYGKSGQSPLRVRAEEPGFQDWAQLLDPFSHSREKLTVKGDGAVEVKNEELQTKQAARRNVQFEHFSDSRQHSSTLFDSYEWSHNSLDIAFAASAQCRHCEPGFIGRGNLSARTARLLHCVRNDILVNSISRR
jgi:hypothetical protein